MSTKSEIDRTGLEARLSALAGLAAVRAAAERAGVEAYLVGGAIRDTLMGFPSPELDVVVVGDPLLLVGELDGPARVHGRFGTATVELAEARIDVAAARTETYAFPGALPEVRPASIVDDLSRRDFSINAVAAPLRGPFELLDPHRGIEDLERRRLRLLHDRSIADDPTRALRGARYAARFALEPVPETLGQIRAADLSTVSDDRIEGELRRLAGEASPRAAFELLDRWGLRPLREGGGEAIDAAIGLLETPAWAAIIERADAILAALATPSAAARSLAERRVERPSEGVSAARGWAPVELLAARLLGADWLDEYVGRWRHVRLAITGDDLLAAGVAEGPALGRGLASALAAKLDGEAGDRAAELQVALAAADRPGRD